MIFSQISVVMYPSLRIYCLTNMSDQSKIYGDNGLEILTTLTGQTVSDVSQIKFCVS